MEVREDRNETVSSGNDRDHCTHESEAAVAVCPRSSQLTPKQGGKGPRGREGQFSFRVSLAAFRSTTLLWMAARVRAYVQLRGYLLKKRESMRFGMYEEERKWIWEELEKDGGRIRSKYIVRNSRRMNNI